MKNLLYAFALLVFCFAAANFAQEQPNSHTLRGVVKNQDSEVIPAVRMVFKSDALETPAFTDINGEFEVRLAPGRYELTVSQTISGKFVAFITIQENGLNPDFIEFVVETDSNSSAAFCPKIVKFEKPVYPAAARAVRAMGEVVVEIKIDKTGGVTSAKAVSGHPLLRQASEQAALKSTFESSETDAERDARLTFVFIQDDAKRKDVKRFSIPCRLEVIEPYPQPIDVTDY
ncbi:MAG TPA: TonB family protein [Pyrinomonadaceae bacterium]|jgi:TonB family protein